MWLGYKALQKRSGQTRLADAWLARKQRQLSLTSLCFQPAAQQDFEFFFASNKHCQAGRVKSLKATFLQNSSAKPPRLVHRSDDALEVFCPQVV